MGWQQEGEFGLRRRLHMVLDSGLTYAIIAPILHVTPELLQEYIENPSFLFDTATYDEIIDQLPFLPHIVSVRAAGPNYHITFIEKPWWLESDVMALVPPTFATKVACFVEQEAYAEDIMTGGPYSLDTWTVQQAVDAATGEQYERLFTVVYYEPVAEYPYYPST